MQFYILPERKQYDALKNEFFLNTVLNTGGKNGETATLNNESKNLNNFSGV